MTYRDEDEEIIDSALDTLAWQRREIDRLTAEVAQAAKAERDRIVAYMREVRPSWEGELLADEIETMWHLK